LVRSSNQQFQASDILNKNEIKKPDNRTSISSMKKNEDVSFNSNSNKYSKLIESAKDNTKAKEMKKTKETEDKKGDYLSTSNTLNIGERDFLGPEEFKNLQFELSKTYNKELCAEQINIISRYMEIGKVLNNMIPGILNNVNPTIRMSAFKILVSNIYDWPKDEGYFNSVICFLPSANHKEAEEFIKRVNRNNCCCIIF